MVVPLKNWHKGALPPIPPAQSEKPSLPRAPFRQGNGEAASFLSERGDDEEEVVEEGEENEEEWGVCEEQADVGSVKKHYSKFPLLAFSRMTVSVLYIIRSYLTLGIVMLRACDSTYILYLSLHQ